MRDYESRGDQTRRQFVRALPLLGSVGVLAGTTSLLAEQKKEEEEEVSTNEDLMREHGILKRVLLAYDEIIRRIRSKQDFPPSRHRWRHHHPQVH